jgi:NADP-dependent 3-hydroxy acid dehydrogenase YdfG
MKDMLRNIVLITGGGSGIGREIAKKFVDSGSKTIIIGRRIDQLEETKKTCDPKKQNNIFIQQCDITKETDLDNLIAFIKTEFGKIDILVNNAGASSAIRTISNVTEEMWDNVFDLNVKAVYQLTQKLIPLMLANKSGTIITISSMAALSPGLLGGAPYGAAKAGVTNLMGHINSELNSKGIRATAIMPAEVDTPILKNRAIPPNQEARDTMMKPEDLADTVFLCASLPQRTVIEQIVMTPINKRDVSKDLEAARNRTK